MSDVPEPGTPKFLAAITAHFSNAVANSLLVDDVLDRTLAAKKDGSFTLDSLLTDLRARKITALGTEQFQALAVITRLREDDLKAALTQAEISLPVAEAFQNV